MATSSDYHEVPQISVVMSTFNRGELLVGAVRSVLDQDDASTPPFELIVVDNNSIDETAAIVRRFTDVDARVRYVFEPRQGLSYARNTGIEQARAPLIAFTDDDVRVQRDWVASIARAFREYSEADVVGGRVLPLWPSSPPEWLTREHWAPLALMDHGAGAIELTSDRSICLVGANVAFRREAFERVGFFATDLQRVNDGVGSLEDHDFLLRLLRTGRKGVYDPRIVVHAEIQPNRLEREYHRRWHTGHGHFHALLRSQHMEHSIGTLFGVPAHLYRQALHDAIGWIGARASRQPARAFRHELRLRFFRGFFRTRRREFLGKPARERRAEFRQLLRAGLPRHVPFARAAGTGAGQGRR